MNRIIKFRQFCSDEEDHEHGWHYFDVYRGAVKDGHWEMPQQFTGLHDKNGKEIYEGDVVRWHTKYNKNMPERIDEVRWENDVACYLLMPHVQELNSATIMEVIGNIYENGNLLEK